MAQFMDDFATLDEAATYQSTLDPLARPEIRTAPNNALPYEVWILGSSTRRNAVDGLRLTRPTASTIQITVGSARDSLDEIDIVVSIPITVDITVAGAGGLDTGAEAASTWYAVWLIYRAGSESDPYAESVSGVLSTSIVAPVLPAGYTHYRRLGTCRNNATSNLNPFAHLGAGRDRTIIFDVAAQQVLTAGTATGWTAISLAGFVPPGTKFASFTVTCSGVSGADFRMSGASVMTSQWRVAAGSIGRVERIPIGTGLEIEYQNLVAGGSTNVFLISFGEYL